MGTSLKILRLPASSNGVEEERNRRGLADGYIETQIVKYIDELSTGAEICNSMLGYDPEETAADGLFISPVVGHLSPMGAFR